MRSLRAAPVAERKQFYLANRVRDQVAWYGAKAAANMRSGTRWFWVGLGAQGLALILAFTVTAAPDRPDLGLVGGLTTVAAVAVAWTQFSRHDELSKSYALAVQELAFLRSTLEGTSTEEAFSQAVVETESAISREHTMWMARRG